MPKRRQQPPIVDPAHIQDAFASDFTTQDWEDWVRLIGFADDITAGEGDGAAAAVRRKSASVVIPRSSLDDLIRVLQQSAGQQPVQSRRHS